jgi:hypothetical protein
MKMKNVITMASLVGLLALGSSLVAADPTDPQGPQFHLGYMVSTGNDMKAMKNGTGYTATLAYNINVPGDLQLSPHLTTIVFPGVDGSGLTNKRPTFMGGLDVRKPLGGGFTAIGGFMGVKWNQAGLAQIRLPEYKNSSTNSDLSGIKMGIRLGIAYDITKDFSVEAIWSAAEANQRFVPSWLALGGSVRF